MTERPNILWVSFEDTNPIYGCYGDSVARTPNLDALAAEGCIWTRCFSTAGVCAPARSAVITGMYPISIGTHHMRTSHVQAEAPDLPTPYSAVIPHYAKCFSEYLRAVGYYCTNNVKTDYQFDPPVTAWDELSDNAHWRNRPNPEQPFFAVFNPTRTHESGMWEDKVPEIDFDPDEMVVPPYFPDTAKVRESMAKMYGNVARSDQQLGEILAELEEDGLAENTIVMHWSDHGPMPRGKRWPYDSGIRVPLIVRWPETAGNPGGTAEPGKLLLGFEPGSVCGHMVSTVDLAPTVLSLAGVDVPQHIQGQSFLGPRASPPRQYIFASRDRYDLSYDMIRATRDQRFKYIRHYYQNDSYLLWIPYRNTHPIVQELYDGFRRGTLDDAQMSLFNRRPAEELYDTETDRHELTNLADDPGYRDDLERLRLAVTNWSEEVGDLGRISEREMVSNWYPGGEQPKTAPPVFVPLAEGVWGNETIPSRRGRIGFGDDQSASTRLDAPALLQLQCSTQGASIAYSLPGDPEDRWRLYTEPIRLPSGLTRVRAKAIRIGYGESEVVQVFIEVQ